MAVYIVNNRSMPVYVARKRFANDQFNGYESHYQVNPGGTDHWNENERLVYSSRSIDDQGHNSGLPYLDPNQERQSGTWTYTFTDGGVSNHEGMSFFTFWPAEF